MSIPRNSIYEVYRINESGEKELIGSFKSPENIEGQQACLIYYLWQSGYDPKDTNFRKFKLKRIS